MVGSTIGPYRVLERLGAGGMGEVFLAEDPRLGRRVAIKRASEARPTDTAGRNRLRREAFAAAQLNHPNVAGIYDVIDIEGEGIPHIVMEYVDGESLASVVGRGALKPEAALKVARQIADALVHAHANSIIHRDLKPGNVMITAEGRVKVLDFGLAKRTLADANTQTSGTAGSSQVYGTPGYMAPEQLLGHRGDARSDIYSFGALLFELLTGEAPFKGAGHLERLLAGSRDDAPRPRAVDSRIPPALDRIVVKAMALDPAARFQTAESIRAALDGAAAQLSEAPTAPLGQPRPLVRRRLVTPVSLTVVTLAAVAVALTLWWRQARNDRPAGRPAATAVAVLPFETTPKEAELEALGAGLAEMIVNGLAASGGITAVPRSALAAYRDKRLSDSDLERIAKDLGVDRIVGGALRRTSTGVELTIRIVRATQQEEDWTRSYPGAFDDALSLGRRILGDVVVELGAAAPAMEQTPAPSVEAFQQYSQARSFLDRRDVPGNLDRAIQLLDAAITREPQFALAHAALGEAHWEKYRQTRDRAWVDRAEQQTMVALATDANQPLVRLSLATILYGTGQGERAEQELRRITASTRLDSAHRLLGIILSDRGDTEAALTEFTRAIEIRPGYWANYAAKGVAALKANRFADAEAPLQRVTELQPDNAEAYGNLGIVYLYTDRRDRAIEYLKRAVQSSPTATTWSNLGTALMDAGQLEEALSAFRQATALRPLDPLVQRNLGDILQRLGKSTDARTAYREGARVARDAITVNAKSADAHGALAICLAKLGEFDESLTHVEQAIALAPATYQPYHRKAAVLALAGRSNEAIPALREAFSRGLAPAVVLRDNDFDALEKSPEFQQLIKSGR